MQRDVAEIVLWEARAGDDRNLVSDFYPWRIQRMTKTRVFLAPASRRSTRARRVSISRKTLEAEGMARARALGGAFLMTYAAMLMDLGMASEMRRRFRLRGFDIPREPHVEEPVPLELLQVNAAGGDA